MFLYVFLPRFRFYPEEIICKDDSSYNMRFLSHWTINVFSTSVLNLDFLSWAIKVVQCIECIDKISIRDVNVIQTQHAFPLFYFKLSINISTLSSFRLLTFLNVLEYLFSSLYLHNINIGKWSLMSVISNPLSVIDLVVNILSIRVHKLVVIRLGLTIKVYNP